MLIEGPVHVAASAVDKLQRCKRCSTELGSGRTYDVGQLVVERTLDRDEEGRAIRLERISRANAGTIYLCDEQPPAAFV